MAQKINGRVAYADLLRSLAVLAVVVLHVSTTWLGSTTKGSSAWTTMCIYDALTRWCVPMFVMLSGAFLLDPKKSVTLRDIFLRYILRLLVALLVWGIFYGLVSYGRISWAGLAYALNRILHTNTHYHLWFLYMMIGLYLITPILRAFVRGASRQDFLWFFLLVFLFYSLIPILRELFAARTAVLGAWVDKLSIHLVLGYVGPYVAGYYLRNYTLSRLSEFVIYLLGILAAVVTVWGNFALSDYYGAFNGVLFEYRAPNVLLMAAAVFVLFRYVLGVSEERSRRQRLSGVARISFGIYLVHVFFIMVLDHFGITTLSFSPVFSIPVLSAVVFLCSFAVAWLISKIPFVGRWLA